MGSLRFCLFILDIQKIIQQPFDIFVSRSRIRSVEESSAAKIGTFAILYLGALGKRISI